MSTAVRRAPPPAATRPSDSLGWPDGPRGTLAALGFLFYFSRKNPRLPQRNVHVEHPSTSFASLSNRLCNLFALSSPGSCQLLPVHGLARRDSLLFTHLLIHFSYCPLAYLYMRTYFYLFVLFIHLSRNSRESLPNLVNPVTNFKRKCWKNHVLSATTNNVDSKLKRKLATAKCFQTDADSDRRLVISSSYQPSLTNFH